MEIRALSSSIMNNSEKYSELLSIFSTLLKHSEYAKDVRNELYKRIPESGVNGFNNFGYFPKNSELHLIEKFVKLEDLEKLGLLYKTYVYDSGHPERKYINILDNHNMIMPYKNVYGDIIGLVGRSILSNEERKEKNISKYKNTSILKGMNLFGMYESKQEILKKDKVFIVEGQFDCITCHRFGIKNVVALGGTAFTKYHLFLLKRYTNNIYLLLDNDAPGQKQMNNIISKFGDIANFNKISIPYDYKDIDEYLKIIKDFSIFDV
jgi:DNA primase catalytic core